jgi:MoxR-like ATPase
MWRSALVRTKEDPATKIMSLCESLKTLFIDRDNLIDTIFHALISRQHVICFGPPGTAKSKIADVLRDNITGIRSFMIQLNGDTLPEELIGPLDFKKLTETGAMVRKLDNYIGTAHLALIDEILSGNSIIREALRRIMNERQVFTGDGQVTDCPLITLIGGTNEPIEEAQDSLVDRFVFRVYVDYIPSAELPRLLDNHGVISNKISLKDITTLQQRAVDIPIPQETKNIIMTIRANLDENGAVSRISDRRFQQMVGEAWANQPFLSVVKASAALHGHKEVQVEDLEILQHCMWTKLSEISEVRSAIMRKIDRLSGLVVELESDLAELDASVGAGTLSLEAIKKWVSGSKTKLDNLEEQYKSTAKTGKKRSVLKQITDCIGGGAQVIVEHCKSRNDDFGRKGDALGKKLMEKVAKTKTELGVK